MRLSINSYSRKVKSILENTATSISKSDIPIHPFVHNNGLDQEHRGEKAPNLGPGIERGASCSAVDNDFVASHVQMSRPLALEPF